MNVARQPENDDVLALTPPEQLKRQMRLLGLSAPELADQLKVHSQTLYNVTSGKRQISSKLAVKLAEKFGQPVEYWLGEPITPAPPKSATVVLAPVADSGGRSVSLGEGGQPTEQPPFPPTVLVDHEVRMLANRAGSGLIIRPFVDANVSPASYDLTIGLIVTKGFSKLDKYDWGLIVRHRCNDDTLRDDERAEAEALIDEYDGDIAFTDTITLERPEPYAHERHGPPPPKKYDAVGIVLREELKFNRDFLARAGGTTKNAIRGLMVGHGLQVDPGYSGPILITAFTMGLEKIELKAGQKILSLEIIRLGESPEDPYHEDTNSKIARILERLSTEIADLFDYEAIPNEDRYIAVLRNHDDESLVCDGSLEEVRSYAVQRVVGNLAVSDQDRAGPFLLPFTRALGQVTIEEADADALIRRFPNCEAAAVTRTKAAFNEGRDRKTLKETLAKLDLSAGPAVAKLMGIKI